MSDPESSNSRRRALHLQRLQRLADVFYAIVIWQLFMLIPTLVFVGRQDGRGR